MNALAYTRPRPQGKPDRLVVLAAHPEGVRGLMTARHHFSSCLAAVVAALVVSASDAAEDARLIAARRLRATAVEHLRKARAPGGDRAAELKRALTSLAGAKRILASFKDPVPVEVVRETETINSLVYWTRKTAPIDVLKERRAEPATTAPERSEDEARRSFEKADEFARRNPDEHFLIAVRFFEVADRFQGTKWSLEAQRLSLEHQRKAAGAEAPEAHGDAARATEAPDAKGALEFEKLVTLLRSDAGKPRKAEACRAYAERFPQNPKGKEARAFEKVFSSESLHEINAAWIEYAAAFPEGAMAAEAGAALARAEPLLRARMIRAIGEGAEDRALNLGSAYLKLFGKERDAREIRSLLGVIKAAPGPGRVAAARDHVKAFPRGSFTEALGGMIGRWETREEEKAVQALLGTFDAEQSPPDFVRAIDEFLKAHPDGRHSREVKTVRRTVSLDTTKLRLVAARKYLEAYPGGVFADVVKGREANLAEQWDDELHRLTMEKASGRYPYSARLSATEDYLSQFPEGRHAKEIREAAQTIGTLIDQEKRAYEGLRSALTGDVGADEGTKLCGEFLRRFPGGPHGPEVEKLKAKLASRLGEEREARAFRSLMAGIREGKRSRLNLAEDCRRFLLEFEQGQYAGDVRSTARGFACTRLEPGAGRLQAAAFGPGSGSLVSIHESLDSSGSEIWVWKLPEVRPEARYRSHPAFSASSAASAPDGGKLWIGEESGGLISWDARGGEALGRYRLGTGPITCISASASGDLVVTACRGERAARAWNAADWSVERSFGCPGGVSCAALSTDGTAVAVGGRRGCLVAYEADTGNVSWTVPDAHSGTVDSVAFSSDGSYLASCSLEGGDISLWHAASGDQVWEVEEESTSVMFVDDTALVTGRSLRSVRDGRSLAELGDARLLDVSPDGRFALTADDEGAGKLRYLPALLH